MAKKTRKKFEYTFGFETFGRVVFRIASQYFRVKPIMPDDVNNLKEPYLVLSNHVGSYDPFIIGTFIKDPLHWVASDAVLREPVIGWFLRNLGVIPKKKNVRDTALIRDVITAVRDGGSVALFPEGVRSWNGNSLSFDPSIAKLVRLLKIPVVTANLKGMSLSNPRWVFKPRKTERTELEFQIGLTPEQIKSMNDEEVYDALNKLLGHNEIEWQRENKIEIQSNTRAEHVGYSLYVCPECKSISTITAAGNEFKCEDCGYDIEVDKYGFYHRPDASQNLHFDNIADWYNWEEKYLSKLVSEKFVQKSEEPIFTDVNMDIYKAVSEKELKQTGTGDVSFYIDRIEVDYKNGEKFIFELSKLKGISPQFKENIEIFYDEDVYRFTSQKHGVSGIKYEVVANTLWKHTGEDFKLVPYVKVHS
ncbi:MAG: 1-acyl-sn-glycerol-3-phosphate acyltransferase [Bacteroidota bacterium]